jgi:hypothetical protein
VAATYKAIFSEIANPENPVDKNLRTEFPTFSATYPQLRF